MFTTNITSFEVLQEAIETLNEKLALIKEAKKAMDIIANNYEGILSNYKEYANSDIYGVEELAYEMDNSRYTIEHLFNWDWKDLWDAIGTVDDIIKGKSYDEDIDESVVDINGHEFTKQSINR